MFELLTENNISFPDGFLWGTGTAGHQIEGNNIHSQRWNEELALHPHTIFMRRREVEPKAAAAAETEAAAKNPAEF